LPRRLALTPDQIRLLASLGFNFLGKAPGVVAVFVILPLVSRSLGTAAYGELLSALALGSLFTLPFGGISAVGRRILASAFGAKDQVGQANAFITTTVLMAAVAIGASVLVVGATASSWSRPIFILVSLMPLLVGFANGFDNARASFNEHYVTAAFQLVSQIVIYSLVYFVGLPPGSVILALLALQSPYLLASVATLVALLWRRPYLTRGKMVGVRPMVAPALGVVMADGALGTLLNLSVYWLKAAGSAEMAAWVGTFLRLFQSFLSPALLILFPLTTYISMRWAQMSQKRQMALYKLFILAGLSYGLLVGCAMAFALRRAGVGKVTVLEAAADEKRAGIWLNAARMNLLRTPKGLPGPELGIVALSFQAWYEARHGQAAYTAIDRIKRTDWADYLSWYKSFLDINPRYGTRVQRIEPAEGCLRLHLEGGATETTRKIVLATGFFGGGERFIPDVLTSGDHGKVDAWRRLEAERLTRERRPDLWAAYRAVQDSAKKGRPEG